jgi:ABC-type Fe3+ transport system substrate-binding protein
LGRPEFQSWVSCGDPGLSGSVHAAFETVLQGSGWERGYQNLARMASNTRAFNEGGSSVPRDVALGQAAVGPCIDFYASAPARRQGVTHVRLVVPKEQAAVTADCIAIFRHPPNAKAARAFMAFVLGETGQRLWYQKRGQPGGPKDYDLERLPVMPRIYEMGLETNTVMNPFKTKTAFTYDSKKAGARWGLLNDLWRAMWSDVHAQLFEARRAVSAAGRDEDLGMLMTQAPIGEEAFLKLARKHMTADERNALRNRWSAWARGWYGKIRRAAETGGEAPAWEGL